MVREKRFIRLKRAPALRYDVRSMWGRSCGGKGKRAGRELLGKKEWSRDGSFLLF